jgi:hypothetical protein
LWNLWQLTIQNGNAKLSPKSFGPKNRDFRPEKAWLSARKSVTFGPKKRLLETLDAIAQSPRKFGRHQTMSVALEKLQNMVNASIFEILVTLHSPWRGEFRTVKIFIGIQVVREILCFEVLKISHFGSNDSVCLTGSLYWKVVSVDVKMKAVNLSQL